MPSRLEQLLLHFLFNKKLWHDWSRGHKDKELVGKFAIIDNMDYKQGGIRIMGCYSFV